MKWRTYLEAVRPFYCFYVYVFLYDSVVACSDFQYSWTSCRKFRQNDSPHLVTLTFFLHIVPPKHCVMYQVTDFNLHTNKLSELDLGVLPCAVFFFHWQHECHASLSDGWPRSASTTGFTYSWAAEWWAWSPLCWHVGVLIWVRLHTVNLVLFNFDRTSTWMSVTVLYYHRNGTAK